MSKEPVRRNKSEAPPRLKLFGMMRGNIGRKDATLAQNPVKVCADIENKCCPALISKRHLKLRCKNGSLMVIATACLVARTSVLPRTLAVILGDRPSVNDSRVKDRTSAGRNKPKKSSKMMVLNCNLSSKHAWMPKFEPIKTSCKMKTKYKQ